MWRDYIGGDRIRWDWMGLAGQDLLANEIESMAHSPTNDQLMFCNQSTNAYSTASGRYNLMSRGIARLAPSGG
jgi:muramidase (phage lysozyme)